MTGTQPLTDDDPRRIGGYTLTARLGQGGQGVVYLGRDDSDGGSVAVKTLHSDGIDAAGLRRQLAEEIETARKVARFCTAQVLAADIDADPPYVVSEYIEGPTLREVVLRDGPLRGASLERLAVGTLTALAAIHQAGIVHRDFKPGNVLIGPDGPRVIDFGIARALEGTAILTSQIAGTPAYMAPEQIAGEALEPAVDLFSWGSTIVFAANGRSPFGQDSLREVLHSVANEPPELGELDGRLREIAERCLAKAPGDRPTAAETLMGVLGVAMSDPAAAGAAEADEPGESGALPVQTLAAGAVAAAAPEVRERTAAGLRDSLPQGSGSVIDEDGLFRSFPPAPPRAGTGPQHPSGQQAAPAAPSGPQTPPPSGPHTPPPGGPQTPPSAAPVPPGGEWQAPGSGAPPRTPPAAGSGPQHPHGGPSPMPPTGGQQPYGYGPPSSAPASGPQPPHAPGPGGPPQGRQPYGPGTAPPPAAPYAAGPAAGPTGGQAAPGPANPPAGGAPYGPGPQGPGYPGAASGPPQPPYGPGSVGGPPVPSGPQASYAPGRSAPGWGPQPPAYGPAGSAPARSSGGSGAGMIIGVVAGASLLVVIVVVAVIVAIVS
ncbi:serine/threonine-protein kinase [Streptomonospora alba]|uniref:serine/threonine-protein kinase n=1 Tax=Streptomonospora alba TaxID=183763 RepID=UPI00069987EF|nr:serine/threonine-protein kinase [Streptomonospora alba]